MVGLTGFSLGAVRSVSTIQDKTEESAAGFYQTLLVDINNDQKKVGAALLGKNLAEAIEIFEYDFSVKAVLGSHVLAQSISTITLMQRIIRSAGR